MNNSKENSRMNYENPEDFMTRYRRYKECQLRMLRLYELTDEETIAITEKLIAWMQDGNWYNADPMVVFLIKKQDLIIERLKELLEIKQDDGAWKYWVILKLMPYLSFENQEKLIPAVRSVGASPTDEGACSETFDAAIDAVIEYRNRKEQLSNLFNSSMKLCVLPDADIRYAIREELRYYTEVWSESYSMRSLIIAKQDIVVDDIRDIYLSDEYGQDYKQLIYDNIIIFFTKENQEKILGEAVK